MSKVINQKPSATAVEVTPARITDFDALRSGLLLLDDYGQVWFSKHARVEDPLGADLIVLVPEFASGREWAPYRANEVYGPFRLLCDPDALGVRS